MSSSEQLLSVKSHLDSHSSELVLTLVLKVVA